MDDNDMDDIDTPPRTPVEKVADEFIDDHIDRIESIVSTYGDPYSQPDVVDPDDILNLARAVLKLLLVVR